MTLYQPEPVEISTRMRPGEWTESSLEELVTTYRARILAMGAAVSEVVTEVLRNDDGSVAVRCPGTGAILQMSRKGAASQVRLQAIS